MKKVLATGAALMLAGGIASTASAAKVEPGVKITGDARVRMYFMDNNRGMSFGNNNDRESRFDMDSRVRLNFVGTTASGVYARTRMRIYESRMEPLHGDSNNIGAATNSRGGVWVDMAYVGIPFTDNFTLEIGKYRSTYGPLPNSYNFFYDDVISTGFKGIIKFGSKDQGVTINPFFEWVVEAQDFFNDGNSNPMNTIGREKDEDAYRLGVHVKGKINKDWTIGGMLGYQIDNRDEWWWANGDLGWEKSQGFFGSIYVNGKSGPFGLIGEFAITDNSLNNFNSWEDEALAHIAYPPAAGANSYRVGSRDTGYGGYIFPNFQIDKLNIGLNLGFTKDGFMPDLAFGDGVLLGSTDNSVISAIRIGDAGDWLWAGLVVSYQFQENLKLTGNFFYAEIDAWESKGNPYGDGPNTNARGVVPVNAQLERAWTISGILQYTLSKGTDIYFSAGYLKPYFDEDARKKKFGLYRELENDGTFAAATRLEIKF